MLKSLSAWRGAEPQFMIDECFKGDRMWATGAYGGYQWPKVFEDPAFDYASAYPGTSDLELRGVAVANLLEAQALTLTGVPKPPAFDDGWRKSCALAGLAPTATGPDLSAASDAWQQEWDASHPKP